MVFSAMILHCKAILGQGQPGLMISRNWNNYEAPVWDQNYQKGHQKTGAVNKKKCHLLIQASNMEHVVMGVVHACGDPRDPEIHGKLQPLHGPYCSFSGWLQVMGGSCEW